jgi:hypothetical protein
VRDLELSVVTRQLELLLRMTTCSLSFAAGTQCASTSRTINQPLVTLLVFSSAGLSHLREHRAALIAGRPSPYGTNLDAWVQAGDVLHDIVFHVMRYI